MILLSIILIIWLVVGIVFWINNPTFIGPILCSFFVFYVILSFGKVNVDQKGAMLFFGRPITDLNAGIFFAPFGIFKVEKEKGTVFQDELPGEPETIFREKEGEHGKTPEGMFPPIRILFGPPNENDTELKGNPYNKSMVTEVTPVVAWRIESLTTFLKVMGDVKNCRKNLSDKSISVCTEDFSKITPAKAMISLEGTNSKLKDKLENDTTKWGISIHDAFVKPFNFSHKLNSAVVSVSVSEQTALSTKVTADAEKYKLTEEGKGKAEAEKLFLKAQALGYDQIAKKLNITEGTVILKIEAMKQALEKAQYSIVPGTEIYELFTGLSTAIDSIKKSKKDKE